MSKKTPFFVIARFVLLLLFAELIFYFFKTNFNFEVLFFTPFIFLAVKITYDIYTVLVYKERLFSYFEDYLKELFYLVLISLIAGGIAFGAQIYLRGDVRITILAVVSTLYLKKNKQ